MSHYYSSPDEDLAELCAPHYGIVREPDEESWHFRVRVARAAEQDQRYARAHDILWNMQPSGLGDFRLDASYDGESEIEKVARRAEAGLKERRLRMARQARRTTPLQRVLGALADYFGVHGDEHEEGGDK